MSRYRKVEVRLWGDHRVRALTWPPPSGLVLFLRFLTGPETTSIPGLFAARESGLAESLGWDLKGFREAFAEGFREGLFEADWKSGIVYIPKAIKHNEPQSPNVVTSWAKVAADLPDSDLKEKALQAIGEHVCGMGKAFGKAWAKAFGKASGKALLKAMRKPLRNQEQEQEQELTRRRFLAVDRSGEARPSPLDRVVDGVEDPGIPQGSDADHALASVAAAISAELDMMRREVEAAHDATIGPLSRKESETFDGLRAALDEHGKDVVFAVARYRLETVARGEQDPRLWRFLFRGNGFEAALAECRESEHRAAQAKARIDAEIAERESRGSVLTPEQLEQLGTAALRHLGATESGPS